MMSDPLVTIMMPVFNAASTLPCALASVLAQTYQNWELIVLDESTISIEPLVSEIKDPRITLLRLQGNRGRGYCRALALDKARGEYLAMVDADDWAYPWKLERQVQTLQGYRNLVAVSCPVAVVNEANEIRGIRGICRSSLLVLKGSMGLEPLGICFPATVFRMDAARRAGFRPDLRAVEDWDFMIRALSGQDYAVDSEVLYAYRHDLGGTSNTGWRAYMLNMRETRKLMGFYKQTFPVDARIALLRMYSRFPIWVCRWFLATFLGLHLNRDSFPTSEQDAQFKKARDDVAFTLQNTFGG